MSAANLAGCAYLLTVCEFPASVSGSARNNWIASICREKLEEIKDELLRRFRSGEDRSATVVNALAEMSPYALESDIAEARDIISSAWRDGDDRDAMMCAIHSLNDVRSGRREAVSRRLSAWIGKKIKSEDTWNLLFYEAAYRFSRITANRRLRRVIPGLFGKFLEALDLKSLAADELIRLHALSLLWYDLRRENGLDTLTRSFQQKIASELKRRDFGNHTQSLPAYLLSLSETIETANHAQLFSECASSIWRSAPDCHVQRDLSL